MTYRSRELKACQTCARAKSKCELEHGATKCNRCQRLNKDCTFQQHVSQHAKSPKNQPNNNSDLLRLESKVDSMSQLLSTSTTARTTSSSISGVIPAETHEARTLLDSFRLEMMPLFPFVHIHPTITPSELLEDKPVVYLAAMMAASQSDTQKQMSIATITREEISRRFLNSSDQDLALLEGLLLYLAWNHAYISIGPSTIRVLHMVMALITELGLDREPHMWANATLGGVSSIGRSPSTLKTRTLAERRVFLGAIWLKSIFTICSAEFDGIKFGRYAENSCQILEDAMEHPDDLYLVQLVRVQRIADSSRTTLHNEELESSPGFPMFLSIGVASLEKSVQDMGTTLSLELPQAALMVVCYQMVQVHIYKISLEDRLFPSSRGEYSNTHAHGTHVPNPYPPGTPILNRNDLLTSCWTATKGMTRTFLTLPPLLMFSMPYPIWLQLAHSLLVFSRLLTVRDGTWNRSRPTIMADFRDTILRLSQRLEEVMNQGVRLVPPRRLPDIFHTLVERLKEISLNIGMNSEDFALDEVPDSGEGFLMSSEALDAIDQFLIREAAQASLFNFSSYGGEAWV